MIKINNKKGNTAVTYPLILFISIMFIIMISVFFINSIFPFIWYQKLNLIAQKYMFVIEKFGYLTDLEKNTLINDLVSQGFDISKIEIYAPSSKKSYGELLEFKIKYEYNYKNVNGLNLEDKTIDMFVLKSSYSKI